MCTPTNENIARKHLDAMSDEAIYSTMVTHYETGVCTFNCYNCVVSPVHAGFDDHVDDCMDVMGLSSEVNANAVDKKYAALLEYFCSQGSHDITVDMITKDQALMAHICAFPYLHKLPELTWTDTNPFDVEYFEENPQAYDYTSSLALFPYDAATNTYTDTVMIDVGYGTVSKNVAIENE